MMEIPPELLPDIIPGCPLSTRFIVAMHKADLTDLPSYSTDPDYAQLAYLYMAEHLDEEFAPLYDGLELQEKIIAAALNGIAWAMLSNHVNQDVTLYDVYVAMCDFEKTQRDMRNIHENGFLNGEDS